MCLHVQRSIRAITTTIAAAGTEAAAATRGGAATFCRCLWLKLPPKNAARTRTGLCRILIFVTVASTTVHASRCAAATAAAAAGVGFPLVFPRAKQQSKCNQRGSSCFPWLATRVERMWHVWTVCVCECVCVCGREAGRLTSSRGQLASNWACPARELMLLMICKYLVSQMTHAHTHKPTHSPMLLHVA